MEKKTITVPAVYQGNFSNFPKFHRSGSIKGMRKLYYGANAKLIKCGQYIYKVTPEIFNLWLNKLRG